MKIKLRVAVASQTGQVVSTGQKLMYSALNFTRTCGKWVRETGHKHEKYVAPVQSSGLTFRDAGRTKNEIGSLGYMLNSMNSVQDNATAVGLFSLAYSNANGLYLYPDNFMRAMALFAARKIIKHTWINNCDEYCAPTPEVEASDEFKQFAADSLILALFHPANNCTAVRGIPFKGGEVDVHNNMFWETPEYMRELADREHCPEVYNDLRGVSGDPYVSTMMRVPMGVEAKALIDAGNDLLAISMEKREMFSRLHPEYHLNAWDAGYFQLKHLWREHYKEEHDELSRLRKELEKSLIPRVYSLGFLRTYEGMGLQVHDVCRLAEEHAKSGRTTSVPELRMGDEFADCSICGGTGCAFCHSLGSREQYLYNSFWHAVTETEIAISKQTGENSGT